MGTARCQVLLRVADALVQPSSLSSWSASALRPPRADRCSLPLSSYLPLLPRLPLYSYRSPTCLLFFTCLFLPLRSSLYLSGSLLYLFPLQSSPLRAPRDCFSGSYGALSHTWAFIKSLILKDKFEYLYKGSLIYMKVLDLRLNTLDNAIHRSKQYRSEVLQARKVKEVQDVLDKPGEVCRMSTMQYSKTALSQSDASSSYLLDSRPTSDNTSSYRLLRDTG